MMTVTMLKLRKRQRKNGEVEDPITMKTKIKMKTLKALFYYQEKETDPENELEELNEAISIQLTLAKEANPVFCPYLNQISKQNIENTSIHTIDYENVYQ